MDVNSNNQPRTLNDVADILNDLAVLTADAAQGAQGDCDDRTHDHGCDGDRFHRQQNIDPQALGKIFGGLGELLAQQGGRNSGYAGGNPFAGTTNMSNFTFSDTGDPHLTFNGQTLGGKSVNAKWDDMNSEHNLVDARVSGGDYRVSTQVGTPINSAGTTLNKSATVTFKGDAVTVNAGGQTVVKDGNKTFALGSGQTVKLASGMTVSESADGKSVTVIEQGNWNPASKISTTITQAGSYAGQNYLNVSGSGQNVAVGGAMMHQADPSDPPTGSGEQPDRTFEDFQASDTGDPHLAFKGEEAGQNGQWVNQKWDDMQSQSDLIHADVNGRRLQVATDVGQPLNAAGVTENQNVSFTEGRDKIVDDQGVVTLSHGNYQPIQLQAGETQTFTDDGLTVSEGKDGKTLTVTQKGPGGQDFTSTVTNQGDHLDLGFSGRNVKLGGAMVDKADPTWIKKDPSLGDRVVGWFQHKELLVLGDLF